MNRFVLKKLVFCHPNKPPAIIDFKQGLNVISGPSDTGKTLIFECLNYILGGAKTPKEPPEAKGYTNLFLTITSSNSDFTLERSVLSDDIRIYKVAYDDIEYNTENEVVSSKPNAEINISSYLLSMVGISNKRLRKNASNETVNLTFNILRKLLLVNESKIQDNMSPVLTGQRISETQEKSLFRFILTGIDYSNIIVQQKPEIRKADANARIKLLNQLIDNCFFTLKKDATKSDLEDQLKKINDSIDGGTSKIFENQKEIEDLREMRKLAFDKVIYADSKTDQLTEILSRFVLLTKHYQTDFDRLDAIIETGNGLSGYASYCFRE